MPNGLIWVGIGTYQHVPECNSDSPLF